MGIGERNKEWINTNGIKHINKSYSLKVHMPTFIEEETCLFDGNGYVQTTLIELVDDFLTKTALLLVSVISFVSKTIEFSINPRFNFRELFCNFHIRSETHLITYHLLDNFR